MGSIVTQLRLGFERRHRDSLCAWTGKRFDYTGKAWNYVDITCRPQPLQRPHPPIYYGATSPESPAMVARRGWNLALSRQPLANCAPGHQCLSAERAALGKTDGGDAIMVRDIYVADTDEKAWRRLPRKLPASGNWPPTTSGAVTQFQRTIFLSSPSASPIFLEV